MGSSLGGFAPRELFAGSSQHQRRSSRVQRVWDEPALQHGEEENWRALC